MREMRRRKAVRVLLVGFIVSLLVTLASSLGYLDFIQKRALDLMVWWKTDQKPSQVIVTIDDEAFRFLGEKQPLSRRYIALLVDLIQRSGAKVIGLDVELKARTDKEADIEIERVLNDKTVIPYRINRNEGGGFLPEPLFMKNESIPAGFANTYIDSDGLIRKTPLRLKDEEGNMLYSFAYLIYMLYLNGGGAGGIQNNTGTEDEIIINYTGEAGSFPAYPSLPLYLMAEKGVAPPENNPFRGKIVLIGATFRESRDFFLTPKGLMSGVEVQANIVNSLITRSDIRGINWIAGFMIQLSLTLLAGIIFIFFRPLKAAVLNIAFILLFFVPLSYLAYSKGNYWIDFVIPVTAVALTSIANDYFERRKIKESFSQYVSNEVVERIYTDDSALEGQRRTVSVLFSDIRGFTTISESIAVEELIIIMNKYFSIITDTVLKYGGMVNKFIGDAVMAIYGVPLENSGHARLAARTAVEIRERMDLLNVELKERGIAPLQIGIGVHSGEVFAGNVGTKRRKEYTIMGDTVNIASRIEGLNKQFSTTILISENTYMQVRDIASVVEMGPVEIRGRKEAVRLYELKEIKEGGISQ